MPGQLLHVGMTCMCPHGGQVQAIASYPRVKFGGQIAVTTSDTFTVSACPFQIPVGAGTKPQPCIKVQWLVPATRVRIGGNPALVTSCASGALCLSAEQIPQGPPSVSVTQVRAKAQ
jgi:hypothetical protein